MFRKIVLVCGLLFASLLPSTPAYPAQIQPSAETRRFDVTAKDIDTTLENSWFGMYTQGKKIGYMHVAVEKVEQNDLTVYRTIQQSRVKLLTLGQKGEIRIDQTLDFEAHPPFALLKGEYLSDDGKSQKHITVEAKGKGSFEATITVGKATRKLTRTDLDFKLSDNVVAALWLRSAPSRGETLTLSDLDLGELRVNKVTMRMVGTKEIVHDGAKLTVTELEKAEHFAQGEQRSLVRCDRNGFVVGANVAGIFEMRKESESDARNTEFPEDMILSNMVKLQGQVGDLRKVEGMTLKGKGNLNALLPQTALQTIAQEQDDTYLVKIGKNHGTNVKATPEEIKQGLEEDETYPIRDAKVVELATKIVGDAKTDQEKVNRLCKFVKEYIKYEIVYLPKVHDILERKVGDCKSYALLFTCLARAAGLPAREAVGYFYMGDDIKGFGGHAWNEVLLDGRWTPIDATLGHTNLLPFYICVGTGAAGRDNMARTMGKLSFELVNVQSAK